MNLAIIIISLILILGTIFYFMPQNEDPNAIKIESYFKNAYPERYYCNTWLLGNEEDYDVYGVSSKTQEFIKGGGKWNYFKYFGNGHIEEFEVKPEDKYWKTPGK